MFEVNWLFGSGEEAQNRFSRWGLWRPSWICELSNFSYLTYKMHQYFLKSIGCSVQEKKLKTDFQDGHHGGHLGFLIETIFFFFFLSTNHSDASYQVSSQLAFPFRRRSSKQNFKMTPLQPSWISDKTRNVSV